MLKSIQGVVFLTALSLPILAENTLEEIVVTATRTEKLLQNSPYSVSVLSEDQLDLKPVDQLAELLREIPGIYLSDAGQAGQQRLRIRGEEGRRMAMLIDGQEFGDHREVGVPLLIDPGEISRIELVRGPASVLYGPKAMGGVVNIITRKQSKGDFSARISTAVDSATNGVRVATSMGGVNPYFDWRLGYTNNKQQERETPAGAIENTAYESDSVSFSIGKVAESWDLRIRYQDFSSSSEVYVAPEIRFTLPFVDFGLDVPQRDRQKVSASYRLLPDTSWIDSVQLDAYRQSSERGFHSFPSLMFGPGLRNDTTIITDSELVSIGSNLQVNFVPGDRQELVAGIQYVSDRIDQIITRTSSINGLPGRTTLNTDQASQGTLAFYIQEEISLTKQWALLLGARYYQVEGELERSNRFDTLPDYDDSELIKSFAVTYSPSDNITWRLNYSDGYIFPSLLNLTVGAFAGSSYINPSITLKPETSRTMELGIRVNGDSMTLDVGAFATRAKNYIDHLFCETGDQCLGSRDKIYRNIGEANSQGIEIAAAYNFTNVSLYSNLTWLSRELENESVKTKKSGIPKVIGSLGIKATRNLSKNLLEIDIFSRFSSQTKERTLVRNTFLDEAYAGYATINANFNLVTPKHYKFALQLTNLADKKYSTGTENLFAKGRSASLLFLVKF